MNTLAELRALGEGLNAHCGAPYCVHSKLLDLDMLIKRFGPDYSIINEKRIAAALKCEICGHKGAIIHRIANQTPRDYRAAKGR
jgi:hypothetical protein